MFMLWEAFFGHWGNYNTMCPSKQMLSDSTGCRKIMLMKSKQLVKTPVSESDIRMSYSLVCPLLLPHIGSAKWPSLLGKENSNYNIYTQIKVIETSGFFNIKTLKASQSGKSNYRAWLLSMVPQIFFLWILNNLESFLS